MNKRIIMIEGCDRTGKSTFISYLEEELKKQNKIPLVFHLMGPTKFTNLSFNNDDKSLIQLSKFNDEYDLIREILKANENIVIILDRTAFGEYIWTRYWNRIGKYTEYVNSDNFFNKHLDLFEQTIYIEFFTSDIEKLENRIKESDEDTKIFIQNNLSIKENILYVYKLYADLERIIKALNIEYYKFDNNKSLENVLEFAKFIIKKHNT